MGKVGEYMNTLKSRKKKTVTSGKGVKKGEEVSGARAAYGESGIGAQVAASAKRRDDDKAYMRRKAQQFVEANASKANQEKQKKTNEQVKRNIRMEYIKAKLSKEPVDHESIYEYAQDYVPIRGEQKKVKRK